MHEKACTLSTWTDPTTQDNAAESAYSESQNNGSNEDKEEQEAQEESKFGKQD